MKRGADLLSSFDRSWEEFSKAWKKARSRTSEKSIHDLRVKTRRFIAVLELVESLSSRDGVAGLQRRLKKVLKRMGPLRDLQVQLENVSQIPQAPLIADFKNRLERRERREIKRIPDELKKGNKHRLAKNVKHVLSGLGEAHQPENGRIRHRVERVLMARQNEFLKAERRFQRRHPGDEEALHEMRIALKKMRYVVEAAQPVLDPAAKQRARQMRAFQKLMGDSRDLEMLRADMEKWAAKKGRKIAIVPALERLEEKRQRLIRKIVTSAPRFDKLFGTERPQPVVETTRVVDAPAAPSMSSRLESGARPAPRLKR